MPKYQCIRKCWHNKTMFKVGQIVEFPEKEAPRHFVPVEEFSDALVEQTQKEDAKKRMKNPPKIKAQKAE